MDIIFDSKLAQIFIILLVALFSISSFFWPRFIGLLLPIILPFYLIKANLPIAEFVLPVNLLDVLMALFLIINWRLVIKGIPLLLSSRADPALREGRGSRGISFAFVVSIALLLLASVTSTAFAINQKTALGAAKSWFWLPILLFFALTPLLRSAGYRLKLLYAVAGSGMVITAMSLPFILQNLYTYDGRLAGMFLSPNHLAMALVPGILALALFLPSIEGRCPALPEGRGGGVVTHYILRITLLLVIGFELLVLYLTYSYGTWLGLIVACLVIIIPNLKYFVIQSSGLVCHPERSRGIPLKKDLVKQDEHTPSQCFLLREIPPLPRPSRRAGFGRNDRNKGGLFLKVFLILLVLFVILYSQKSNPKFQHIINGDYYSSFHSRIMIWQSALLISKDHWLLGVGAGNFQQAYLDYQQYFPEPYIEWAVPMPHNIFLAFQTQLGVLGLVAFILILVLTAIVILGRPRTRCGGDPGIQKKMKIVNCKLNENCKLKIENLNKLVKSDSLSLWAFAYLVYIIFHGIADTPYFKNDLAVLFWLALAAIWSAQPKQKSRRN